jgi:hypothetical protein
MIDACSPFVARRTLAQDATEDPKASGSAAKHTVRAVMSGGLRHFWLDLRAAATDYPPRNSDGP